MCKRNMIGCLSHAPNWGPGPQPRHVPWPRIKLVTFQFAHQHSIHWATPARAIFLCLRFYLFTFREWGREGEREGEKLQCVKETFVASHISPTGDLACNSGMYLDWELNWQPFGLQAGTQPIEPHQPGHIFVFLRSINYFMFTRLCILF